MDIYADEGISGTNTKKRGELKEQGVSVIFEKENINTMDAKGEVLLTMLRLVVVSKMEMTTFFSQAIILSPKIGFFLGEKR